MSPLRPVNAAGDLRVATLGLTRASRNNAAGYFRARALADYPWADIETADSLLLEVGMRNVSDQKSKSKTSDV